MANRHLPNYVTTRTPLRISFAGGGTDLPDYYRKNWGAVYSTAIDKHIYVTLSRMDDIFGVKYRLNYSIAENVQSLEEIKNKVAQACLKLVPVEPPIYISTIADIPASSGLGSSASFAVGLLLALHTMRGEKVTKAQLAEEAAHVEIEMLQRPIGRQDQYAAAFGGMNYIQFKPEGVSIGQSPLGADQLSDLFGNFMMFWTGISRDAGAILSEQNKNTEMNLTHLDAMRAQASQLAEMMQTQWSVEGFGEILDEGWQRKRALASSISTDQVDTWYEKARKAGAIGGKLCGAGGGGFLLLVVPPEAQTSVTEALSELHRLPIEYEPEGTQLLVPVLG